MADINWGYGGGSSAGEFENILQHRRERLEKRAAAPDIAPALAGGDEGRAALGRVAQASPDVALKLATMITHMGVQQATVAKSQLEIGGRLALGVMSGAPADQPALYASALEQAKAYGLDTSKWPQTWSPATAAFVKHNAHMVGAVATQLKRMDAGTGGGAPGGGFGGPPLPAGGGAGPRVSAAPGDAGGAVVADAGPQPLTAPAAPLAATGPAIAPRPQMAGAGPMPGVIPPGPPRIAPAGAPPVPRPQAAPAPVQVADAAGGIQELPDDSGGDRTYAADPARAQEFGLAPGEMYGVEPKSGKIIQENGWIMVRTRDRGDVLRRLPKERNEPPRPIGEPKPPGAPVDRAAAWSVYEQLPTGWQMLGLEGKPIQDTQGRYLVRRPDGQTDYFLPHKAPDAPPNFEPNPSGPGVRPIQGGPADPAQARSLADARAKADAKAIPPAREKAMTDNLNAVQQVDRALALLEDRPGSVGGKGSIAAANLPGVGSAQNRWGDPEGTGLRALISNIGSLVVHERSGAAVTASEYPRLRPFIPSISDNPEQVRTKLQQFRAAYLDEMAALNEIYSPGGGYRSHGPTERYLQGAGPSEYDTGAPAKARKGGPAAASPANGPPPEKPPEIPKGRADDLKRRYGLD